jgi:protein ImuB
VRRPGRAEAGTSAGSPQPAPGAARYACAVVPGFAAAALVRQDPALRGHPVAALVGTAVRTVVAVTPEAAARGVRPGMSATEAAMWAPVLLGRLRDPEAERAAAGALLDAAWTTSPRVEVVEPGCLCLDLAGLRGDGRELGEELAARVEAVGLPVRVGVGATRAVARLAARAVPGVTVVPAGTERAFLASRPLELLEPPPDLAAALERWGVRTLGALAALPPAALLARLGPAAVALRALAVGADAGPFVPHPSPEPCREALALEWEVTALPALAFVLDRLLGCLATRLALRGAGAAALTVTLDLADGGRHGHHLAVAVPLRDARTLGRLLLVELEALQLPAPVVAVAVEAVPAPLAPLQTDLFAPSRPSPRELGETLGRLTALVGADRVGAPAVPDTHRPDAVVMAPFPGEPGLPGRPAPPAVAAGAASGAPGPLSRRRVPRRAPPPERSAAGLPLMEPGSDPDGAGSLAGGPPPAWLTGAALVRRRLTPPRPAAVRCVDGRPVRVEADGVTGAVVAAAGPWRTEGEWWTETAWARAEWDVALPDGAAYRLAQDLATGAWTVDAVYD